MSVLQLPITFNLVNTQAGLFWAVDTASGRRSGLVRRPIQKQRRLRRAGVHWSQGAELQESLNRGSVLKR